MRTRKVLGALLTGAMVTSAAYAGTVLVSVEGGLPETPGPPAIPTEAVAEAERIAADPQGGPPLVGGQRLPAPLFLVGADATSIAADPEKVKWDEPEGTCSESPGPGLSDHSNWPGTTQDCIYMGGFGLGPVRAAAGVDELGIHLRSLVVSNGEQAVVLQVMDTVGYFFGYQNTPCEDCGIAEIRTAIEQETGVPAANVMVSSTHTHSGPDTLGGWGGVPGWYLRQIRDAAIASAGRAAGGAVPARLEVGAFDARQRNSERRNFYRSSSDFQGTWLRATTPGGQGTIATLLNFGAHPTTVGSGNQLLGSDFPGVWASEVERALGGVALYFMGGLGNQSPSGSRDTMGTDLAARTIASIGAAGRTLTTNDIAAAVVTMNHPVSNEGLLGLGRANLFTRSFDAPHASVPAAPDAHPELDAAPNSGFEWWKDIYRGDERPRSPHEYCQSPGPQDASTAGSPAASVAVDLGAYRIGDALVAFGPGELFSGLTIAVKSWAKGASEAFVIGLANDELGYIIQSYEFDEASQAVVGDAFGLAEYEEILSIDRCIGDHVVEHLIRATQDVGLR